MNAMLLLAVPALLVGTGAWGAIKTFFIVFAVTIGASLAVSIASDLAFWTVMRPVMLAVIVAYTVRYRMTASLRAERWGPLSGPLGERLTKLRYVIADAGFYAAIAVFFTAVGLFWLVTAGHFEALLISIVAVGAMFQTRQSVDDEHDALRDAWAHTIVVSACVAGAAVASYFAMRYAQWNGYLRLDDALVFTSQKDASEVALLILFFCALLYWAAWLCATMRIWLAAIIMVDDPTRLFGLGDDDNEPRAPVRAPGRSFGARVRAGRDPYATN